MCRLCLLILVMCCCGSGTALAWGSLTHAYITEQASKVSPGIPKTAISASVMPDMVAFYSTRKGLAKQDGLIYEYAHESQPPAFGGEPVFGNILVSIAKSKFPQYTGLAAGWKCHQLADTIAHDRNKGFVKSIDIFPSLELLDHGFAELAVDANVFDLEPQLLKRDSALWSPALVHEASLYCTNDGFSEFPYPNQRMLNCPSAKSLNNDWQKCLRVHRLFLEYLKSESPRAYDMLKAKGDIAFTSGNPCGIDVAVNAVSQGFLRHVQTGSLWQKCHDLLEQSFVSLAEDQSENTGISQYDIFTSQLTGSLDVQGFDFTTENPDMQAFDDAIHEVLSQNSTPESQIWNRFVETLMSSNMDLPSLEKAAILASDLNPPEISGLQAGIWSQSSRPKITFIVRDSESGVDWASCEYSIDGCGIHGQIMGNDVLLIFSDDLSEGHHSLEIWAYDNAGNCVKAESGIMIDQTAPEIIQIEIQDKSGMSGAPWACSIESSEPVQIRWELAGIGMRSNWTSPEVKTEFVSKHDVTLLDDCSGLANGAYRFDLYLTDRAGNETAYTETLIKNNGKNRRNTVLSELL